MKVVIISGRYPETTFDSSVNHKLYADKFGYTYIHCNWPTKAKNLYLNKIYYLLAYFDFFDYLIWIDDDAFFFDFDKDVMDYKPKNNAFISLCKSPTFKTLKTPFSSGQFILQCNSLSKDFLKCVINQNLQEVKSWWQSELGYFTNGDQDAMVYLLHTQQKFINGLDLHDYKTFNSRFENLEQTDVHQPLILHFTGKPEIKIKNYNLTQKKLNLTSSLVPVNYLKEYTLPKKSRKKLFYKRLLIFLKNKFK
ncbi:hypothetical protein [Mesoflavibacter sp. CH_XMU1422-2]|uniref:hypothetical protein n=1 Tax=Mesoflavibacter sp. CH_XMU1422-2 TaxID=3107770 RepID=UPI00300A01FD